MKEDSKVISHGQHFTPRAALLRTEPECTSDDQESEKDDREVNFENVRGAVLVEISDSRSFLQPNKVGRYLNLK